MPVAVEEITTVDEVRSQVEILRDYLNYVCNDLRLNADIDIDPEPLLADILSNAETFVPPLGAAYVAKDDEGDVVGIGFMRPVGGDAFEIKRVFVRRKARGLGAGKALMNALMDRARSEGASEMLLDSSKTLSEAIGLYEKLGFTYTDPYPQSSHYGDKELEPILIFMRKSLV